MPKDIPLKGLQKSPDKQNFYYSFDYLWVHVITISIKDDYSPGSEQYLWLHQDLERAHERVLDSNDQIKWIIVLGHTPLYSSSNGHTGGNKELKKAVEPLFLEYGVDLALWGDDHVYERTYPIYDEQEDTSSITIRKVYRTHYEYTHLPVFVHPKKPIHLLTGTAGIGLDGWLSEEKPSWSAVREIEHGHVKIAIGRDILKVEFIRMSDKMRMDEFWISKEHDNNGSGFLPFSILWIPVAIVPIVYAARRRYFSGLSPNNFKRVV
jgi:hypothetical protein